MARPVKVNSRSDRERGSAGIACPACSGSGGAVFYEHRGVPVHSVLLMPTREAALSYPRGNIVLAFCPDCGFVFNRDFDPALLDYSPGYEATQGFSPTFAAFHRRLAHDLIERFNLRNKEIVEIGCGMGDFLTLLCEMGPNRGIGFDPAYVDSRAMNAAGGRATFVSDLYSEANADRQADFVCCKMTLEHIPRPGKLISLVRRTVRRADSVVFFQIPEVTRILEEGAFWDVYYEHCSYFAPESLARLFRRCGFTVSDLWTDYDGQYLMVAAHPTADAGAVGDRHPDAERSLDELAARIDAFSRNTRSMLDGWTRRLADYRAAGKRVAIWGSGSKGVAFLSRLGVTDEIAYGVDINPHRQGTFMAGTGQEIVAPAFLREYRPDVVIVMNPIYEAEIRGVLGGLGLDPELIPVV